MTARAVNVLVTEPIMNWVESVAATEAPAPSAPSPNRRSDAVQTSSLAHHPAPHRAAPATLG